MEVERKEQERMGIETMACLCMNGRDHRFVVGDKGKEKSSASCSLKLRSYIKELNKY